METSSQKAFNFLCKRNVLEIEQSKYVSMLMELEDKKGEHAIEALAGFYIWVIDNYSEEEKQTKYLLETFGHDLSGRNDPWELPRSDSYKEFWLQELSKN